MGVNVATVVHYYNIRVLNEKRETVEFLQWSNMRWDIRLKYDWYFKYRAALLQVKYPKYEVKIFWGREEACDRTKKQLLENQIKAKKAKITSYKNKLEQAEKHWTSMFPISEDEMYKKAQSKIKRLEFELIGLYEEIQND